MKSASRLLLIGAACLALAVGCRKSDIRTVTIDVPAMRSDSCATRVETALKRVQGVNHASIAVDVNLRRVTVSYNSLALSLKNIEFAIADVGFDANDVPARKTAQAELPAQCRPE